MRAKIQLYLNVKNARRLNMIIAIDGNKSAGKSTIITNLKEFYKGNHNILFYKFPTYTETGLSARNIAKDQPNQVAALLWSADYYKGYYDFIEKNQKKILILDRYLLTLFVHQGFLADSDYSFLFDICKRLPFPDHQIVIHRKSETDLIKNNPFVITAKLLVGDKKIPALHVVENIVSGGETINKTGFNTVLNIIENIIH